MGQSDRLESASWALQGPAAKGHRGPEGAPQPAIAVAAAKSVAHWLLTGLPLLLVAPLCAELLALPHSALPALLLGLALGTPALALLIGARYPCRP